MDSQYSVRRLSASVMALAGFLVALLAGMRSANPASSVVVTSLIALLACNLVGTMLGMIIEWVLMEHRASIERADESAMSKSPAIEANTPLSGDGVHEKNVDNLGIKAA